MHIHVIKNLDLNIEVVFYSESPRINLAKALNQMIKQKLIHAK